MVEPADTMVIIPTIFTVSLGQGKADIQPMTVIGSEVGFRFFNPGDNGKDVGIET